MATNVNLSVATFATTNMLPDAHEELTADWARKVMQNSARAAGYVGTVYAEPTSVATLGTAFIYFTGFQFIPSIDLWCYEPRGGTVPVRINPWAHAYTPASESGRIVGKILTFKGFQSGTGTFWLEVYPHPHANALGPEDAEFQQLHFGTWIYRLRGV